MGKPEGRLTPAQHEIMDLVWQAGTAGATVTEIWTAIADSRYVTRTTVFNLVENFAAVPRDAAARELAREFVDDFFGGSAGDLVTSLLGSKRLRKADVRKLRQKLDALLAEIGLSDEDRPK